MKTIFKALIAMIALYAVIAVITIVIVGCNETSVVVINTSMLMFIGFEHFYDKFKKKQDKK